MSVETLTDSELRSKLAEYGYPVGPVTQTTRKILVKKLSALIASRGGGGSRHSLVARYSSDDTDDDASSTVNRKKKTSASNRRQTMANPMPPPAAAAPLSTITIATGSQKSPSKRRTTSRNSETKETQPEYDIDISTNNSTSRTSTTTKVIHKKTNKNYKLSSINDGLETGSDSDIPDDSDKPFSSTKYNVDTTITTTSSKTTSQSDARGNKDRNSVDVELPTAKFNESRSRSTSNNINIRDDKYVTPSFKPNISPIPTIKEDKTYKRDDLKVNDLLANYESPYLSEFTRRLSSQTTSVLSPQHTSVKSTTLRHSLRPESKDSDTNGHYSSLRTSYNSANSRYIPPANDRPRDIVTRSFKTPVNSTKEESRNNQNIISMILVIVLALFFGILAVVYLGLGGGKSDIFPSLPAGRYSE